MGLSAFSTEIWHESSMQQRIFYQDAYGFTPPSGLAGQTLYGNPVGTADSTRNYDTTFPADFLPIGYAPVSYVMDQNISSSSYILLVCQLVIVDDSGFPLFAIGTNTPPVFTYLTGSASATASPNQGFIEGTVNLNIEDPTDTTTFAGNDLTANAGRYTLAEGGSIAYAAFPFPIIQGGSGGTVTFYFDAVLLFS